MTSTLICVDFKNRVEESRSTLTWPDRPFDFEDFDDSPVPA